MSKRHRKREYHFKLKPIIVAEAIIMAINSGDLTMQQFNEIVKLVKHKIKK